MSTTWYVEKQTKTYFYLHGVLSCHILGLKTSEGRGHSFMHALIAQGFTEYLLRPRHRE